MSVLKPALLITSAGEQKELACFQPDKKTEAFGSCSVNWKNQLHIFGGATEYRQISRLSGFKLERIGDLAFDHESGSCSLMANQFIFLCFNYDANDYKRCRRSTNPLETFEEVSLSNHEHRYTKTGCTDSKSSFLATKL